MWRCAGCKGWIELQIPEKAEGVKELRAALATGYHGTLDKTVKGAFTGVYHWYPTKHHSRVLVVEGWVILASAQNRCRLMFRRKRAPSRCNC